jgi:hypothetical protein
VWSVSETIRQDLQRRSYHRRRLIESRLETVVEGTNGSWMVSVKSIKNPRRAAGSQRRCPSTVGTVRT